ncbi:MAG: large conductance mechanosensitive channel protein MscL [Chloroflexota bacterium]|nr:large conductance mechanosensitive channel protein MscL [Chloroflexota bacterium]
MIRGFRDFILRGNVVDLAIAVVIGAAFGAVVTAFVKDLITPLIAAVGGKPDFSKLSFVINKSHFLYGDLINAVLSFLIVAAVIYFFVVVPYTKLMSLRKTETAVDPVTRDCPYCLGSVPVKATRCSFCTSEISPEGASG